MEKEVPSFIMGGILTGKLYKLGEVLRYSGYNLPLIGLAAVSGSINKGKKKIECIYFPDNLTDETDDAYLRYTYYTAAETLFIYNTLYSKSPDGLLRISAVFVMRRCGEWDNTEEGNLNNIEDIVKYLRALGDLPVIYLNLEEGGSGSFVTEGCNIGILTDEEERSGDFAALKVKDTGSVYVPSDLSPFSISAGNPSVLNRILEYIHINPNVCGFFMDGGPLPLQYYYKFINPLRNIGDGHNLPERNSGAAVYALCGLARICGKIPLKKFMKRFGLTRSDIERIIDYLNSADRTFSYGITDNEIRIKDRREDEKTNDIIKRLISIYHGRGELPSPARLWSRYNLDYDRLEEILKMINGPYATDIGFLLYMLDYDPALFETVERLSAELISGKKSFTGMIREDYSLSVVKKVYGYIEGVNRLRIPPHIYGELPTNLFTQIEKTANLIYKHARKKIRGRRRRDRNGSGEDTDVLSYISAHPCGIIRSVKCGILMFKLAYYFLVYRIIGSDRFTYNTEQFPDRKVFLTYRLSRTGESPGVIDGISQYVPCPSCGKSLDILSTSRKCPHCGVKLPRCGICGYVPDFRTGIAVCPSCFSIFHRHHLERYATVSERCPVCGDPLNPDALESWTPPSLYRMAYLGYLLRNRNEEVKKLLIYGAEHGYITPVRAAILLDIPPDTARELLDALSEKGFVTVSDSYRTGRVYYFRGLGDNGDGSPIPAVGSSVTGKDEEGGDDRPDPRTYGNHHSAEDGGYGKEHPDSDNSLWTELYGVPPGKITEGCGRRQDSYKDTPYSGLFIYNIKNGRLFSADFSYLSGISLLKAHLSEGIHEPAVELIRNGRILTRNTHLFNKYGRRYVYIFYSAYSMAISDGLKIKEGNIALYSADSGGTRYDKHPYGVIGKEEESERIRSPEAVYSADYNIKEDAKKIPKDETFANADTFTESTVFDYSGGVTSSEKGTGKYPLSDIFGIDSGDMLPRKAEELHGIPDGEVTRNGMKKKAGKTVYHGKVYFDYEATEKEKVKGAKEDFTRERRAGTVSDTERSFGLSEDHSVYGVSAAVGKKLYFDYDTDGESAPKGGLKKPYRTEKKEDPIKEIEKIPETSIKIRTGTPRTSITGAVSISAGNLIPIRFTVEKDGEDDLRPKKFGGDKKKEPESPVAHRTLYFTYGSENENEPSAGRSEQRVSESEAGKESLKDLTVKLSVEIERILNSIGPDRSENKDKDEDGKAKDGSEERIYSEKPAESEEVHPERTETADWDDMTPKKFTSEEEESEEKSRKRQRRKEGKVKKKEDMRVDRRKKGGKRKKDTDTAESTEEHTSEGKRTLYFDY